MHVAISQTPKRQYFIVTDFFRGFKAREYSIYDQTGKNLQYRIESKYHILQSLELVTYPTKKVIGKLQANLRLLVYKGNIEIFDDHTQQWLKGVITQNFQLFGHNWTIKWNDRLLSMETDPISLTTNFFDKQHDRILLAKFQMRVQSFFWVNQYDMEVYSNAIPDGVYLLSLAARDHTLQAGKRG
ncbi:unnamed protein product [Rotaria sp. Silwood1]|nr:unnamed protein product [Rotaria sp. Silwood1]CAF4906329.1 unnamed protein product [Rotaria sp. Silwood1]